MHRRPMRRWLAAGPERRRRTEPLYRSGQYLVRHLRQERNAACRVYRRPAVERRAGIAMHVRPEGDPVVIYDWLADRFVLTHFAFASVERTVLPVHRRIEDQRSGRRRLVAVRSAHGPGRCRSAPGRRHQRLRQVRPLARLPVHGGERVHAEQRLRRRLVRVVQPGRSLQRSAADALDRLSAAIDATLSR